MSIEPKGMSTYQVYKGHSSLLQGATSLQRLLSGLLLIGALCVIVGLVLTTGVFALIFAVLLLGLFAGPWILTRRNSALLVSTQLVRYRDAFGRTSDVARSDVARVVAVQVKPFGDSVRKVYLLIDRHARILVSLQGAVWRQVDVAEFARGVGVSIEFNTTVLSPAMVADKYSGEWSPFVMRHIPVIVFAGLICDLVISVSVVGILGLKGL